MAIQLNIYTDASHKRHVNYLGIGAYCKYNNIEYKLSSTVDESMLLNYDINEHTCSNPTAEYIAVAEILKKINKYKISPNTIIKFYSDYDGVQKWTNGSWKARKSYIIKIKNFILKIIKDIGCHIEFIHVNGHSGILGNELADELAGMLDNVDNFDKLLSIIEDKSA